MCASGAVEDQVFPGLRYGLLAYQQLVDMGIGGGVVGRQRDRPAA
ncbi:MAG TPA: hypothetical protein VH502_13980 [Actinoplanes sp.]